MAKRRRFEFRLNDRESAALSILEQASARTAAAVVKDLIVKAAESPMTDSVVARAIGFVEFAQTHRERGNLGAVDEALVDLHRLLESYAMTGRDVF